MLKYPNLDTLDTYFRKQIENKFHENSTVHASMFVQVWPNTASPGTMAGQAFTEDYTTVLLDRKHDLAMVAFGDQPGYYVEHCHTNDEFIKDLQYRSMKDCGRAPKKYGATLLWKA